MLAPRGIHRWEGECARLIPRESASARQWGARREWQVRSGRRTLALAVVCAQGMGVVPGAENSKEVFVRMSDGGASQSCLDGTDVRVVPPGGDSDGDGEARRDRISSSGITRVTVRAPGVLSGGWPDSFSSSDYVQTSDRYFQDVKPSFAVDLATGRGALKGEAASVERGRPTGRMPVKRGEGVEDGVYYEPKVGDHVIGTVASGNYGKLEIDIGAKKLAHLFRKDVMPLEVCNVREMSWELPGADSVDESGSPGPTGRPRYVHDVEVLNLALEVNMPVERGTVFTMQVKGLTSTGIALLSARSVARGYAWQRIRQLQEQDAILEVQVTEWTSAGLVSRIEGLRAFLPIYNLVNRPPESSIVSHEVYVGQFFSVMIHSIDETKNNLVVSEKKAWVTRNAYIGALVDGIVTDVQPYGVHLRIKDTDLSGVLHISNISRARIDDIESLFSIGEEVRAMVVPSNMKRRISFCTADLEIEDGLMLRDKKAVYRGAERLAAEIARAYRRRNSEPIIESEDFVDSGEQEIVIANWEWLDFGDKTNL